MTSRNRGLPGPGRRKGDAARKRLARFGLTLHPDKTRLVDLRCSATIWIGRQSGRSLNCRARRRASGYAGFFDGFLSPIAVDVHIKDRGVVHDTVDGGERHSLVGEDFSPFAEGWLAVMSMDRRSYRALISSNRTLVSAWSLVT